MAKVGTEKVGDIEMEKHHGSTVARTFENKKIPPVPYEYDWLQYPTPEAAKSVPKVWLTDEQILKVINDAEMANAKAAALATALKSAGHEKSTLENSDQLKLKTTLKTLLAQKGPDGTPKYNLDSARKAASDFLGIAWED